MLNPMDQPMLRPKKPQKTVAQKTADFAKACPPHHRQTELLDTAIKLLVADVVSIATPDAPVSDEEQNSTPVWRH